MIKIEVDKKANLPLDVLGIKGGKQLKQLLLALVFSLISIPIFNSFSLGFWSYFISVSFFIFFFLRIKNQSARYGEHGIEIKFSISAYPKSIRGKKF